MNDPGTKYEKAQARAFADHIANAPLAEVATPQVFNTADRILLFNAGFAAGAAFATEQRRGGAAITPTAYYSGWPGPLSASVQDDFDREFGLVQRITKQPTEPV
jgi:hypothetical protein